MTRTVLTLGKHFETTVPFSLGVISAGRLLHTAGITARDASGTVVGEGDMRAQVAQCFANLGDILQNAQTRDTRAIQAKLNEIILTSHAENRFIGIENLDEEDLKHLDRLVAKAAKGRGATEICEISEEPADTPVDKPEKKKRAAPATASRKRK